MMTLLRDLGRRFRDERGAVALEDLGMLPIVLVVVLAGWQILVVGVSESCSAVRLRRRHGSMQ